MAVVPGNAAGTAVGGLGTAVAGSVGGPGTAGGGAVGGAGTGTACTAVGGPGAVFFASVALALASGGLLGELA